MLSTCVVNSWHHMNSYIIHNVSWYILHAVFYCDQCLGVNTRQFSLSLSLSLSISSRSHTTFSYIGDPDGPGDSLLRVISYSNHWKCAGIDRSASPHSPLFSHSLATLAPTLLWRPTVRRLGISSSATTTHCRPHSALIQFLLQPPRCLSPTDPLKIDSDKSWNTPQHVSHYSQLRLHSLFAAHLISLFRSSLSLFLDHVGYSLVEVTLIFTFWPHG